MWVIGVLIVAVHLAAMTTYWLDWREGTVEPSDPRDRVLRPDDEDAH